LRRQLLQIAATKDVPIDDILLWETNGQIVNAVACGVLPRRGRILLSDGLLKRLDDQDIVEVFRHELGHVAQFHGLRLMICVISALSAAVSITLIGQSESAVEGVDGPVLASFCVVLMAFLAVGRYSCLLEFEADLWAAADGVYGRRRYLRALEKLADGVEDRRGWLHPSLAQRRDFLQAPRQPASAWLEIRLRVTEIMLIFAPWIVAFGAVLVD
jgi:Zn-dependent protease with chaperone function